MRVLIRYAARNLRRQKARTVLTTTAVVLAVGLVMVGDTVIGGITANLMDAMSRTTGHLRFRHLDYEKESRFSPLDYTLDERQALSERLAGLTEVVRVQPRINFRMMVQYTDESTIVAEDQVLDEDALTDAQIFGEKVVEFAPAIALMPAVEAAADRIDDAVIAGSWFTSDTAAEVVIGKELARRLGVKPGQRVELVSYRGGVTDAEATVVGVFDTGNRVANKLAYVPLAVAESLLDLRDQATEVLVFGSSHWRTAALTRQVEAAGLGAGLEVRPWHDIGIARVMVDLLGFVVGLMLVCIVVVAVAGLLNTMLMTVMERQREIGVLMALGLPRRSIVGAILLEALVFGLLGTAIGLALGLAVSQALVVHGVSLGADTTRNVPLLIDEVIYGVITPWGVARAALIGPVVALLGSLSPALKASAVQPVEAMRSN